MSNGTSREFKMNAVAKVAAGGVLAVIGFVVVKFMLGLVVGLFAFMAFVLLKVVPIVLLVLLAVWLVRRITRPRGAVSTT